jgi:hypothetical protein
MRELSLYFIYDMNYGMRFILILSVNYELRYAVYTYPCVNMDCFISPTILMHNHNRDFLCFNFYQQGFFYQIVKTVNIYSWQ